MIKYNSDSEQFFWGSVGDGDYHADASGDGYGYGNFDLYGDDGGNGYGEGFSGFADGNGDGDGSSDDYSDGDGTGEVCFEINDYFPVYLLKG